MTEFHSSFLDNAMVTNAGVSAFYGAKREPPAPRLHLCGWCATPEGIECTPWCPDRPETLAWLLQDEPRRGPLSTGPG